MKVKELVEYFYQWDPDCELFYGDNITPFDISLLYAVNLTDFYLSSDSDKRIARLKIGYPDDNKLR